MNPHVLALNDDRAHSPSAAAIASAPILIGTVSILLGLAVFQFLARGSGPEEAAVRLFGLIFLGLGVTLVNLGAGAIVRLGARRRGMTSPEPPVALLGLTTIAVIALIAPLHLWWQAPWPAFRNTVLLLDLIALVFILRFVTRLVTRRSRSPKRPLAADARARWTLVGVFFGVSGLMVGWLGAQQVATDWQGWSAMRPVPGLVIRQHAFNFRDPDRGMVSMGAAVVQYSIDGKGFEATIPMDPASPAFRRGSRLDLLYHPSKPGAVRVATAFHIFLIGGVLLVAAVSFLGIASAAFVRVTLR